MAWRTSGWSRYKRTVHNAHNTDAEIYEAGADAMLNNLIGWIEGHDQGTMCPLEGEEYEYYDIPLSEVEVLKQ